MCPNSYVTYVAGIYLVYVESDIIRRSSLQMINAIQEALVPVGQTCETTAPTVSALSRLHGSVDPTGRSAPQGDSLCDMQSFTRVHSRLQQCPLHHCLPM